jgi:hypothetical protein
MSAVLVSELSTTAIPKWNKENIARIRDSFAGDSIRNT